MVRWEKCSPTPTQIQHSPIQINTVVKWTSSHTQQPSKTKEKQRERDGKRKRGRTRKWERKNHNSIMRGSSLLILRLMARCTSFFWNNLPPLTVSRAGDGRVGEARGESEEIPLRLWEQVLLASSVDMSLPRWMHPERSHPRLAGLFKVWPSGGLPSAYQHTDTTSLLQTMSW